MSGRPAPNRATAFKPPARDAEPNPAIAVPLRNAWADLDGRRAQWLAGLGVSEWLRGKITRVVSKDKIRLQLMQEDAHFATQQSTQTSRGGMLGAKFSNADRWRGDLGRIDIPG